MKLMVVSHALVQPASQKRWRRLAKEYDTDVTLLVPRLWKSGWFSDEQVFQPEAVSDGNFKVLPVKTTDKRNWSRYFIRSLGSILKKVKPDVIFLIHEETTLIPFQAILYRKLFCPDAKIIFFTMNALGVPLRKWHQKLRWKILKNNVEAAFCHYPGCEKSLRDAGFEKEIILQTQIGVDEEIFCVNDDDRNKVRKELGFENKFVIGFAGRLCKDKGIDDLFSILPLDGVDWALLLVGNGDLREELEAEVEKRGWSERVHFTGTVKLEEVPQYMRAMDVFVLGSKTRPYWVDTFPLVSVQAMACGVPVVGSDSGAIPWQLEDKGLIFPEGDKEKMKEHILKIINDDTLRNKLSKEGRKMVLNRFSVKKITENFYKYINKI